MRRRWWIFLGLVLLLVGAGIALVLAGPTLTCQVIRSHAPIVTPDNFLIVSGAARVPGPPADLVGRLSPATLRQLASGVTQRWLPGFLFGDGQVFWGTVGEAPWRVEVATSATTSLTGRLTPAQATRLAQTAVGDDGLTLTITHANLVSLPRSEAQQHRFRCTAGGRVLLHWANGPFGADLDIPVHQVIAVITVRPADVPQSITVQIEAIDAVVPLFGSRLGPTAERAINRSVVNRLQEQPLPTWLPWDADVSVIVEALATTEL